MLAPLSSVRQILKLYQVRAEKHLSQNFILNPSLTDKIAAYLGHSLDASCVIEIGCGPGSLTRSILKQNPSLFFGIEKDQRFAPFLRQIQEATDSKFRIFMQDALLRDPYEEIYRQMHESAQFSSIRRIQLIGNLPFNIATPMHLLWLRWISDGSMPLFDNSGNCNGNENENREGRRKVEMVLMFQKEVAKRIVAEPGCDSYGRLSVISQFYCDVQYLATVPSHFFTPRPAVDAGIVHFCAKAKKFDISFMQAERLTNMIFRHPNKTIRNNLKIRIGKELFENEIKGRIPEDVLNSVSRDVSLAQLVQINQEVCKFL